ncbi:coiled-coil domain-containing protein 112-like [Thrips palmi]|uniref:Coiled-coil domain-containing protein 112-like n=1 Tax=Thrips palmi TaxID=161013 RepID=A0A6P8ZQX5_THRPL|nr:coiled-coil domain-containing protein 112-like [Thrips palmi]
MKPDRKNRVEKNLAVQQEVFERAYSSVLNGLKHLDKKTIDTLKSVHSETESHRKKEEQNLKKSLLAIAMVIQKLKHNIRNEEFVENNDTEYFRRHITSTEENITAFKTLLSEQLHSFQEEEIDLQQSIDSLHQRLNETATKQRQVGESSFTSSSRIAAKSKVNSIKANENVHPDVQEFHNYLRNNGGHTGGWDTKDHLLFTRFLQKYRGLDQMTTALLDFMPDKSPEEIAQHESWYHDYLILKDAQRKALKEWRDEQVSQKQKCETMDGASSGLTTPSTIKKVPHERDPSVKEKIQKWKNEQEKQRQQQIRELQEKKRQEEEAWQKKVAYFEQQHQIIVEKRKKQQQFLDSSASQEQVNDSLIPRKNIPLKEFWAQDKQFMQRRQSRLQRFSASPRVRSSSQVKAERDPSRLLRPTAVWQARMKRSLSEEGGGQTKAYKGLYIADVPHLAIPKWRQGVI